MSALEVKGCGHEGRGTQDGSARERVTENEEHADKRDGLHMLNRSDYCGMG